MLCSSGIRRRNVLIGTSCRARSRSRRHYHKHLRGHDKSPHSPEPKAHLTWPTKSHPTPYDIFGMSSKDPYNKSRFFELVKLYHPDRHCYPAQHPVGSSTKLERYRLVVLANSILSDPEKRRKYDLYGAGWAGRPGIPDFRARYPDGSSWTDQPDSPANNATWEDWENWRHSRQGTKKQQPLYMSNGLFAAIILATMAIGAAGQYSWAENHARQIAVLQEEQRKELVRRTKDQKANEFLTDGESRIQAYLRKREGVIYHPPSSR